MEKYSLICVVWYMLLGIGDLQTTEDSEINESLLELLDKENPNFDTLLSEARKYGLDTGEYETPVYIDKKDNLCLNVRLMKGNDTKLAINKEIQRLYVQVPSKFLFPTNEEMIKYVAAVLNISKDSLHVSDSFADRRTVIVSSHLSSSDVVDTIVAAASGNYLSEDGNSILSVNMDEFRKIIRENCLTMPPDIHKIKGIDKGDVERLAKILGVEPPQRVTSETSKTVESQVIQKDSIRKGNSKISDVQDKDTETELKHDISTSETLEKPPTKKYAKVVKNKRTKDTVKLRRTVKPKDNSKKGKRKTKSKIDAKKTIRKSKTGNGKGTKDVIRDDNTEQVDIKSEEEKLIVDTDTEKPTKTLTTKAAKRGKKKTKAEKGKRKSQVGKTKLKTKTRCKIKKTKSKKKTKDETKTSKVKTKTIGPKIKKKVIKSKFIPVTQDAQDNTVIRVKVSRGDFNKLLNVENRHETKFATVDIQIRAPMYQEAFENEVSRYMSQILGVSRKDIKLHMDEHQNINKVMIPNQKLEIESAKQKLKDAFNNVYKFSLIQ